MILATCATIAGILASTAGGTDIKLTGNCPGISISRHYAPPVTINADDATVHGLRIVEGGGVVWHGGILRSRDGEDSSGPNSYGAIVKNSDTVTIEAARFIDSNKALVLDNASDTVIRNNRFEIGGDGVIANRGAKIEISGNSFVQVSTRPTKCKLVSRTREGLSAKQCQALGGSWTDGWHQDAVQFRDGIQALKIVGNIVRNTQQGIGQMAGRNDAPVSNVLIDRNDVEVTGFHSITLNNGSNVRITNNRIRQTAGRRTVIRAGDDATVCGNNVMSPRDRGGEKCR